MGSAPRHGPHEQKDLAIDWHGLLGHLRIEWQDRGANTSRGNVNIHCPWCAERDPSHHLSISEEREAYYCYRDRRHRGRSFLYLLNALGVDRVNGVHLLSEYHASRRILKVEKPKESNLQAAWNQFINAHERQSILDYLEAREFINPARLCRRYDLRYAENGLWAQRLLIPLHDEGQVVSWTGRAIRPGLEPRYRMAKNDNPGLVYCPRTPQETVLIVEGPIDALKIAAAMEGTGISSIALITNSINGGKALRIQQIAESCSRVYVVLDRGMEAFHARTIAAALALPGKQRYISRLELPSGVKDPGEMSIEGVRTWLKQI